MHTAYTHLADDELVRLVQNWPPHAPVLTPLERELGGRLANAVDYADAMEANLAALQAKYDIDDLDLIECDPDQPPPPRNSNNINKLAHGTYP